MGDLTEGCVNWWASRLVDGYNGGYVNRWVTGIVYGVSGQKDKRTGGGVWV